MRNNQLNSNRLGLVQVWPVGATANVSSNFVAKEFDDPDPAAANHFTLISPALVACLQRIRDALGTPITITSGFRTLYTNTRIGGALNSYHTLGLAVDITTYNRLIDNTMQVIQSMLNIQQLPEIGGVGYYPGNHFIHLDVRPKVDGEVVYWEGRTVEKQQA
jgi:uncharacterized protein YcbK (DUF882 family)